MKLDPARICVFCASHDGRRESYAAVAHATGRELVAHGYGLVYGGGGTGLMGSVADATLAAGGEAIGVIPRSMVHAELEHPDLTELRVVETMHERKAMMVELSGALIALPGGLGTFEELLEAITWAQLGIHRKPVGLINHEGFYDGLITLLGRAVDEGFLREDQRSRLLVAPDAPALLDLLESQPHEPSTAFDLKW